MREEAPRGAKPDPVPVAAAIVDGLIEKPPAGVAKRREFLIVQCFRKDPVPLGLKVRRHGTVLLPESLYLL